MKEILHVAKAFPKFEKAVTVHMVEVSEAMRKVQQKVFLTSEKTLADSEVSFVFRLFLRSLMVGACYTWYERPPPESLFFYVGCTDRGVSVQWHSLLREVPPGQSSECFT